MLTVAIEKCEQRNEKKKLQGVEALELFKKYF
jgi:hypothetical protein